MTTKSTAEMASDLRTEAMTHKAWASALETLALVVTGTPVPDEDLRNAVSILERVREETSGTGLPLGYG